MTMNSISWFYNSLFLYSLFVINICISSALSTSSTPTTLSYNDHCSSFVPISTPTVRTHRYSIPSIRTSFFTGGDRLLRPEKPSNHSYYYVQKSLRFRVTRNSYKTTENGIYKLEAHLYIRAPYGYNSGRNISYDGSYYRDSNFRETGRIRFSLNGFWSEFSRKLCMVGSATWLSSEGQFLNLDAVLKLKFDTTDDPTIYTSVISGTLESVDSVNHFDPISIFSFPVNTNYNYSLVSKELDGGLSSIGGADVPKNESRVLESSSFCSVISGEESAFELEYVNECRTPQNCSPFSGSDGFLPHLVSLYPIQCSWDERKIRYLVTFHNVSFASSYQDFGFNSTLIGEGSWDDKNNRILVVGCRILNPGDVSGSVVGDCALRLSLRYPSVLNIRNNAKIVGQVWTDKTVDDSGYSRRIKLKSLDANNMWEFPGLRYEYTELDKVRRSCVAKKLKKKKGDMYPDGQFYDMRFDMNVKNSKGHDFGWGYAAPFFVGNELYEKNNVLVAVSPESNIRPADIYEQQKSIETSFNVSYKISINPSHAVNSSIVAQDQVQIDAEGVYNAETGQLCMVGCRKILSHVQKSTNNSLDCEILVMFEFSPLNDRGGNIVKGTIRSTREKGDPLYLEDLSMSSFSYYQTTAKKSIWRMDMEISMVLISNTLICIFVGLQIFHVKRNPQVLSGVSIVMLLVLSLGLVMPLVLNFEALFLESHDKQRLELSSGGWLEANEVTIRVVTMVAFLLQIRLLQLVWASKMSDGNEKVSWAAEKIAVLVSLPTYIFGGLLTLVLNGIKNGHGLEQVNSYGIYQKYSMWGDLRSFAGLILDGFLLPQVLLNALRGSAEKALCHPFYMGTSVIRVVPHAYDQYRAHNYPASSYVNGTYYYANHTTDFYSTAWDVVIPCGVITLVVIVFLQQRRGGRCILPKRFRELELYEKVPVVDNE